EAQVLARGGRAPARGGGRLRPRRARRGPAGGPRRVSCRRPRSRGAGAWSLALGLMLALSCSPRTGARRTEVTFWERWPVAAIAPLVQRFEAANPTIHVVVSELPADGATDSLARAVQVGRPPDLVELEPEQAARFIEQGWLSDWSAGVADLKPALRGWELCSLGDAIYGLPWLLRTRVLVFNRSLFARAGRESLHGPDTWEELRASAARVQKLGDAVHGFGIPSAKGERFSTFMPLAWANGGELLSARLDTCLLDSPANVQALEYLVSLTP